MKILLCLSLIALTSCLPSKDKDSSTKTENVKSEQASTKPIESIPQTDAQVLDIKEIATTSGITAWLVEDHSLPIISLQFSFKGAGAARDGKDKQGLARLLSNTMDEGAGDLTSQEFQKALSDHSITLRFNSGRDNFGGQLKTLSRYQDKAFKLLKLALNSPRFDAEPVERMRQANLSRIKQSMGDPEWINARIFNDVAFAGHPYALNSGGTLTSLKNITAQDLKNHHQTWLTRDNLRIGVTGDITEDKLKDILNDIFGELPKSSPKNDNQNFTLQNTGKTFVYNKDIPQTIITSALPSIKINDPDYYILRVMNYIYGGGGFGSRLMEEAREKRGLTYGIYSGPMNQDNINIINISTSTKNESTNEMLSIISEEMKTMSNTLVSEDELNSAKSYMTGSMPLSLTSTDKVSGILLNMQLNDRQIDYLDHYKSHINAVTREDIQRVAKNLLTPNKLLTVMVGQPENLDNIETIESLPNVE
jgi:zinc protease